MKEIEPKADFLIEISNEVAHRLGGVHTVMMTKSLQMTRYYKDNYYAIGPYYKESASAEFEEQIPPPDIKSAFEELEKENLKCYYGNWLVDGKPKTFLIDFSKRMGELEKIKTNMLKEYGVDCREDDPKSKKWNIYSDILDPKDIDLKLVWGDSASIFVKKLLRLDRFKNKKGVLQFEFADPSFKLMKDLKKEGINVGIVATSHSTRLGRAIAFNKEDLNKEVFEGNKNGRTVKKGREYNYGIYNRINHQLEILASKYADVLTSVSEVTGKEMQYILGRKPEVITPNGLEMFDLDTIEKRKKMYVDARKKTNRFLNSYFLPYYPINMKDSLIFFTSGRYELITKGFDILFESLAKLNNRLKKEGYQKNIFVLLLIIVNNKKQNDEVHEKIKLYDGIKNEISKKVSKVDGNVVSSFIYGKDNKFDDPLLKNLILKFKNKKSATPLTCAFKGLGKDDPIINSLIKLGLNNSEDDKVKVIFYPSPTSANDGLIEMDYFDLISGTHVGIFPSMYEPWGYTPLESAAKGVISITTDVAGFGKFIQEKSGQRKKPGILVLNVENKKKEDIINELENMLYGISKLSKQERIEKESAAHSLAVHCNWREFGKYYIKAHNAAVDKAC